MPDYRDTLLAQLMFQQMYPTGDTSVQPVYQGPNARRGASMQASLLEDEMLRHQLGKQTRKRNPAGEPVGHYSSTDYAGGPSPWMTAHGVERGYRYTNPGQVMSNQEKMAMDEKGKQWYDYQMRLWGRRPRVKPKTYEELQTMNRAFRNRRAW